METSKITTKGQTTIPAHIRKAAHLEPGDLLAFEVEGDHLIVRKIRSPGDVYLRGVEGTLDEWSLPEDEEAWSELCPLQGGRSQHSLRSVRTITNKRSDNNPNVIRRLSP